MRSLLPLLALLIAGCQQPAPPPEDRTAPADSAQTAEPAAPSWQLNTTTNPTDSSTTVVLYRSAMEVRAHSIAGVPILYIRCKSGETALYIDWHNYIPGASHQVTTRMDRGPTQARMWTLSRSNVATFYPDVPVAFLRMLMQADLLYAEATPYNTTPVTAVFDLTGLADIIQPLRDACEW